MDSSALLSYIVSQTRQNVEFLVSQNRISQRDGQNILGMLPAPNASIQSLAHQTQNLLITPPSPSLNTYNAPSATPSPASAPSYRPSPPQPPPTRTVQAKALWGYNEQGQDPNDLTFHAGDIVEVVTETNADWWTGRYNGRQGLFPSNYVEKIFSHTPPQPDMPQYSEKSSWVPPIPSGPAYAPSYQPSGGYQGPPPPNQGGHYNSYSGPAPPNPTPVQPPGETANPPKKGPFGGKLGNTLAHSAVGGVGFGAGSAVGSGIINAIF